MSVAGWVTMIVANVAVWGGVIWCFRKVLETPEEEKVPMGFGP